MSCITEPGIPLAKAMSCQQPLPEQWFREPGWQEEQAGRGNRGQQELQVPGDVSRSSAPAPNVANPQALLRVMSFGLPRPARPEAGCGVSRLWSRLSRAAAMPSSQLVGQLVEL